MFPGLDLYSADPAPLLKKEGEEPLIDDLDHVMSEVWVFVAVANCVRWCKACFGRTARISCS